MTEYRFPYFGFLVNNSISFHTYGPRNPSPKAEMDFAAVTLRNEYLARCLEETCADAIAEFAWALLRGITVALYEVRFKLRSIVCDTLIRPHTAAAH